MKSVSVIGLGYVGLNVACLCAKNDYKVYGIDTDKNKIGMIKKGKCPINDVVVKKLFECAKNDLTVTDNFSVIKNSDVIVICVDTPVNNRREPDLSSIKSASKSISKYLQNGQLIIVESSLYPGVTENFIKPILEESKLEAGKDFLLAYCPERVDPGNEKWKIENTPRVLGGIDEASSKKALEFYNSILDAEVKVVSSIKTAELIKLVENAFRDVNIAFVNELAKSCAKQGIDVMEVLNGASTKPFAFMLHRPGCGVGGLCIPISPYYIIESGTKVGFNHEFLKLAREINNSMPQYTVSLVSDALNEIGKSIKNSKIAVLGISYKGGVGDLKGSPSFEIINLLKEKGAVLSIFDPYLTEKSNVKSLEEALKGVDCVVIATDHPEFKQMNLKKLKDAGIKVIVDGRNIYDKKEAKKLGIIYKGIGI